LKDVIEEGDSDCMMNVECKIIFFHGEGGVGLNEEEGRIFWVEVCGAGEVGGGESGNEIERRRC